MSQSKASLPDLPYDYNELEPVISAEIMQLHHQKHHNAYVTKFNEALDKYADAEAKGDYSQMINLLGAIKFNGGGHINHSIFWTNLMPQSKGGGNPPTGELASIIDQTFGSLDEFIEQFNTKVTPLQGSGWGWLGYCKTHKTVQIATCNNQDPLSLQGLVPLLGIDVWEHAYYLQYKNARPEYLKNIWNVVNWQNVMERFAKAKA